ncbi:MAG: metal-sensitive transcriptional regulator [Patescibacteria group bacterium]|jgi:DNA-binding FrmR family transcriptional regulator
MTNISKKSNSPEMRNHLHRIIGQLNGLDKMLDENRECTEIITQLMAARASLEKLGLLILNNESSHCFINNKDPQRQLKDLQIIANNLFKLT